MQKAYWRMMSLSSRWDVFRTSLGYLTIIPSPGACAVTSEAIDTIDTGAPIQTGVAQALINVFCAVGSRPA